MRKSRLIRTYARAQALFANGKLKDAALMYEQILRTPLNRHIKRDINLRIRAACFAQLAEIKVALVNFKSNNKEFIDNIVTLFKSTILWLQQIHRPSKIDFLNQANTLVKLAMICMGCDLVGDSLQSYFFNIKNVIQLSAQIQANYDVIKIFSNLKLLDELRIDLAKLYYAIASYLFSMIKKENEKTDAGDNAQKNNLEELINLNEAKKFMLAAIKVIGEAPEEECNDNYWKVRLGIERLAADIYGCLYLKEENIYYQLLIEHCKKIQKLTVESLHFEDTTYAEYSEILYKKGNIECINLAIEVNFKAIARFALLFNSVTELRLIKVLYHCIANRFLAISDGLSKNYGKNSFEVSISKFSHQCYQNISDDFNPSTIKYFDEELLFHCLNFNRNIASYVHALNVRLVMMLICRDDFPNEKLKNFLSDEQNILLFQASMEPIILQQAGISHVDRSDESLEVTAAPAEAEVNTERGDPSVGHRKRGEFTYKDDQITLMSSRHVDKKGRTTSLTVARESYLDVTNKFN